MATTVSYLAGALELSPGLLYRLGGMADLDRRVSAVPSTVRGYQPLNCYLVLEPKGSILIDTGPEAFEKEIVAGLVAAQPPGAGLSVFLTRAEYEGIGNIRAVHRAFPLSHLLSGGQPNTFDAYNEVAGFARLFENRLQVSRMGVGDGAPLPISDRLKLVGPPMRALGSTFWVYDRGTKTLFTSDSFCYTAVAQATDLPLLTIETDTTTFEEARDGTYARFAWLAEAHTDFLRAQLQKIFEEHEIETIAPSNGCVLRGAPLVRKHYELMQRIFAAADPRPKVAAGPRWVPSQSVAQSAPVGKVSHVIPREVAPGIHWLGVCGDVEAMGMAGHSHFLQYLVVGGSKTLLVDTGFPSAWDTLKEQLDSQLKGRTLDYIFPTHPEIPHSGNLANLLERYPGARAVGNLASYQLYFPGYEDRMDQKAVGDEIDLGGGYRFHFISAELRDHEDTLWGYESAQQVMFVADGFVCAHTPPGTGDNDDPSHLPGECGLLTSETDSKWRPAGGVNLEGAAVFLKLSNYSSRFVDRDVAFARMERALATHPTRLICPAHGNVIDRVGDLVTLFGRVYEYAKTMGDVTSRFTGKPKASAASS